VIDGSASLDPSYINNKFFYKKSGMLPIEKLLPTKRFEKIVHVLTPCFSVGLMGEIIMGFSPEAKLS